MVFPVVMYGYESWTIKKAEHQRTDAFELWCWRRVLRIPWTARRSNQSVLKEINPEHSLEGLMLKLKLQYFDHLMEEPIHWKRPSCGERLKARGKGGSRGWDGWIASPTQLIWVWANSRRQRTEETGALQSILSQRVGHNVTTEQQQQCYLEVYIFWRIHVCSMIKIQVVVLYIRVYCVGDSNR